MELPQLPKLILFWARPSRSGKAIGRNCAVKVTVLWYRFGGIGLRGAICFVNSARVNLRAKNMPSRMQWTGWLFFVAAGVCSLAATSLHGVDRTADGETVLAQA